MGEDEVEISDRAVLAAYSEYIAATFGVVSVEIEDIAGALKVAARIIVADAYRARAAECDCLDDCELLVSYAEELDGT